jgi:hypothetical protein
MYNFQKFSINLKRSNLDTLSSTNRLLENRNIISNFAREEGSQECRPETDEKKTELVNKQPIPRERWDDENYKIREMSKLRRLNLPPNKSVLSSSIKGNSYKYT